MKLKVRPSPLAAARARALAIVGRHVHRALVLLAFAAYAPIASAQPAGTTVTGLVKDVLSGEPIEGVSVTIAGTPRGAVTNAQGRYTITGLTAGVYAVEARRVTYQLARQSDIRATGTGTVTVNFDLNQNTLQLAAVTSSATVDPISGTKAPFAVAKLDAEAFPVPTTGAAQAIANKVAGVSVIRGSGDPSDEAWVQLRSMSSPFKDNGPLWVIDGIPLNTTASGNIGGIRTTDIESLDIASIEVIKGAAAAAQYGSAAAGGVISITTNRGKDIGLGTAQIDVRTDMGYDAVPELPAKRTHHHFLMNSKGQWVNTSGVVVARGSRSVDPDRIMDNPYVRSYDNLHQILRANQAMTNTVSLQQNSVSTNYRLSYTRSRNPGIVMNAVGNTNQNVRFNVQHAFKDNLNFTLGLNHAREDRVPQQVSFSTLFQFDPDVNLLRPDITGVRYVINPDSGSSAVNPLYLQDLVTNETRLASTNFNADGTFRPFNWLTLTSALGYRRQDNIRDNFTPPGFPDTDGLGLTDGSLDYREIETDIASANMAATVLRDIGRLTTRFTVRGETQRDKSLLFQATGTNFAITGVHDLTGATNKTNNSTISESRVNSFVSSAALNYADRYIVNANHRYEGNSLFGPDNRWNNFYGLGVSWVASSEPWYPAFMNAFNLAKLRYNYGTAGTKPAFEDQYENIQIANSGFVRSGLGNRDLKPEMKYDHEVGLDLLLNNRISFAYTYVNTRTKGAIVGIEAPASTGYNTFTDNAGGTHGYSHELSVEGQVMARPRGLRWTMMAQASRSAMSVDFYGRSCYKETPSILYRCPGVPVTSYWGGSFMRSADDLPKSRSASKNQWQVDNNGFLVPVGLDANGNPNNWWEGKSKALWGTVITIDGVAYNWGVPQLAWNDSSGETGYTKIGDWQPLFEYGYRNAFNRGNVSFSFLVGGQVGGDIYNLSARTLYNSLDHPDAVQVGIPDSLQKAYLYYSGGGTGSLGTGTYNSYFVHKNATFLKLRETALGYTMDSKKYEFLSRMGASRVNLQLLGRDLFRIMPGYKGIDPEGYIALSGGINTRADQLRYPPGRRFTGSVTVVF